MSDLDRCKKYLRSVLLASKCGIPIKQVSREYSYLYEEDIPFRKLNYPSLGEEVPCKPLFSKYCFVEKFLKSIPDVCMMSMKKGEMMVEVVGTQATSHIKNLVQNTGKKKGGGGGGGGGGGCWSSQSGKSFRGSFPGSYPWSRSGQASPRHRSRQSQVAVTSQAGLGFKARKPKPSQVRGGGGGWGRARSRSPPPVVLKVTELGVKVWGEQVINILRSSQGGGLAEDQVEKLYQAKHDNTLPQMWIKTLSQAGLIDLENDNRLSKTPLIIPAKVRKVGQFGFNNYADSQFVFPKMIKNKLEDRKIVEPRRSDVLPDVENKMKQLNIAGIRPMSEGWVGGNAGTSQLQPQTLPEEGDFYDCKVCHVVSTGEIYVQSYSSLAKYDSMKRVISAFYKADGGISVMDPEQGRFLQHSIIIMTRPFLGMLVAVKINEDWFRAEVLFKLGKTMVGNDFLVKLVDTGKVEVVNIHCMKILEKCFPALPVQVDTLLLTSHCPH